MYLISTIITVLGLLFPATVDSYQNGAPIKACGFLNPGHGVTDQLVPSPYLITPSQTTYQCRETIKVSVTSTDGSNIRGFLCQARTDQYDKDTIVGFLNEDLTRNGTKMNHTCGMGRGLTHTDNTDKEEIKITWFAEQPHGHVTFICSIVKERLKFWSRQVSASIHYVEGGECISNADHVIFSVWTATIWLGVLLGNYIETEAGVFVG